MKDKIKQTVLDILSEKRANRDVPSYATSIEVAHRLKLGAWQVEQIAKDIEGIGIGQTINGEYYHEYGNHTL